MKLTKTLLFTLVCLVSAWTHAAIDLVEVNGQKISFSGFIKLDLTYQDDGMNNEVAPRFAVDGDENFNATAMHSRFALKWSGFSLEDGTQIGALLEWDLFDTSPNNMKFRDRIVAITIDKGRHAWIAGQHWDVFSPLNPITTMTNGNLWQTGNMGVRRAQLRYTYSGNGYGASASINDGVADNIRDNGSPIGEARCFIAWAGRGEAGLSIAAAEGKYPASPTDDEELDIFGISLDWSFKLSPQFSIRGELHTGENLETFASRATVGTDGSGDLTEQETDAYWLQGVYEVERYQLWLGYANEDVDDDALAGSTAQETAVIFVGFKRKYGAHFSWALEFANFNTDYANGDDADTNQALGSVIFTF